MVCEACKQQQATVHLTEIVNGQMAELHLCEACANQKGAQMESHFGLSDLLAGLADFGKQVKDVEKVKIKCSSCGMSYEDFRKFGRLGCSECYVSYREHLGNLLKKIHGSNRHLGKTPTKIQTQTPRTKSESLEELKQQLQQAVKSENFEKAAQLRDRIHELEERQNS